MPPKIKLTALTLLLAFVAITTRAQPFYFKHYQAEDGLLNNTIVCLLQDSRGFMWVGTKGGLNRFDGYTFKSYSSTKTHRTILRNDAITTLREDKNGMIWIGTSNGIFRYDSFKDKFDNPFPNLHEVPHIRVDSKNNVWFLSNGRLYQYKQKEKKLIRHNFTARCLAIDKNDKLWMGKMDGRLIFFDPVKRRANATVINKGGARSGVINKLLIINDKEILIGTRQQGIKLYNRETKAVTTLITYDDNKNDIFVRDILDGGDNIYWMATESGLMRYDHNKHQFTTLTKQTGDAYSLSDNAVYCLAKDNNGGLWAGTFFGGLNYCSAENMKFKKYYPIAGVNAISGNAVREICPDENGKIWIGTEDAGLNKFDPVSGKFTHFMAGGSPSNISYHNIHGLLVTGNKAYIGPFQQGLDVMDATTGKVSEHFKLVGTDNIRGDFVMTIYKRKNGELLIGTTIGGLMRFDEKKKTFERLNQVPKRGTVYCLLEDHEGTMWSGSLRRGVFYFNDKTGNSGNIGFKDSTSREEIVQGIYEDKKHNMWFATEGNGLFRLSADRKKIKKYTTDDGLPTNNLYRILEDDDDNLWISSLKGLICFNTKTEHVKVYTQANGLITDQFNYNSAYKDPQGNMYFGSVKGMVVFNPATLERTQTTPPTYITGFQINNTEASPSDKQPVLTKSILFTDTIELNYNQSTFSIEFAALSFSSAPVIRYKYMMKGVEGGWTYLSTNRKAYFTDLAPGDYTFVVQAQSNVGSWHGKETKLFIRVTPPIWKSNAAYVMYSLLLIASVFLSVRYYHDYLEAKNANRLRLFELQKEKEIYQAKIEFFTNIAHEIQTPLTLIIGPVDQLKRTIDDYPLIKKSFQFIEKNSKRLLALTEQLLDFRKTEMNEFGLSFVNANISALLKEQLANFKPEADRRKINLSAQLPKTTLTAFIDKDAFLKIISNLISNAIKYATSKVEVSVVVEEDTFCILFTNDGKPIPESHEERIFEPFFRLAGSDKPGTGIGLSLARSLTELHNGTLKLIKTETDIITFRLTLPVHQKVEFKLSHWKNTNA